MANSIEIEIIANFKDNATDQVKELNAELDKLEKRNVSVSVNVADRATQMASDIENRLSHIDNSKATAAIDKVNERAEKIVNANNEISVTANTSAADSALSGLENRMQNINRNASLSVRTTDDGRGMMFSDGTVVPYPANAYGHYRLSNETRTLQSSSGSDIANIINNARTGNLAGNAERIADELSDINHSTTSNNGRVIPEYHMVDPHETIADYERLRQDADMMGIKYKPNASNEELSQMIADYEDKNYYSKQGSQSNREIIAAGEEQGEEITDGYLTSLGQGMKSVTSKVASRFMGARMLYKGISDAASDFTSAFEAENGLDKQRSLARGATKAGLMGAGALVGSLVGMPMLGAGAGALVSDLFGDDLADALSGIHKSAAELAQDHIDELFGDIAMSADEMMVVVKGLTGTTKTLQMGYNQQSVQTEYALAQASTDSYYDIKEQGSRMEILNNLGLKTDKSEREAYKTSVTDYTDGLKKQLLQEMYDSFAVNDDLYGYGNWDATELSKKYEDTYGELEKTTKDLFKYLDRAFSDNDFSTDEIEHVASVLAGLKELSSKSALDEFAVNNEKYDWLLSNGLLSKDSYDALQSDVWTDYDNQVQDIANTRAKAVLDGTQSADEANKNAFNEIISSTERHAQTYLKAFDQTFGEDYTTELEKAYNGKDTGMWDGRHALGILNDSRESDEWQGLYAAYESEMEGNEGMLATGLANFSRKLSGGWDSVDNSKREVFKGEYEKVSPEIEKMENYLAAASQIEGVDISAPMDELMRMYSIGAMGGGSEGKVAANKFNAMYMAGNEEMAGFINQAFGSDYERMDKFMGEGFSDAWQLIFGKNKEGSEQVENQLNEAGEKIKEAGENAAQKASDAAEDAANAATNTVEESTNSATETIKDKTEDMFDGITDTIEKGSEKAENATKDTADKANELGQNILEAVSESLDNIDADMLSDSNIGEKLMSAIGEGIDTMDFENIEIGEQLMSAIGEAVDTMDFEGVDIGEKIMSAITEAVDTMDFSEVSVGESVMDGISQAIDTMDFEGISIGESIMAAIVEAVDTMDLSEIGIGESIMDGIGAAVDTMDFSGLDIGAKIMDGINASVEAADISGVIDPIKSDLEALNAIECTPNIEAQDNASSVISSVSSALSDLDGQSATVTVNIQQNGSLPTGFHFASGTPNAPEGLGWVNDDGTADPRELIEHNGQFMMYEGRDVLAPLSKGDRVFTSAQTKDILAGKGIPHFAEGVNNEVIANNRETIGSGSSGASVSIDGLNINITIEGNSNGNVVEEIRQRSGEIAEIVTAEIQRHLSASFANASGGDD